MNDPHPYTDPCVTLTRYEVGLAIDAVAMLVRAHEPSEYRPLLHRLQDAYRVRPAESKTA